MKTEYLPGMGLGKIFASSSFCRHSSVAAYAWGAPNSRTREEQANCRFIECQLMRGIIFRVQVKKENTKLVPCLNVRQ
jgi:hypothetical protein